MSSTLDAGPASPPPSEQPPRQSPPGVPLGTIIAFLLGGLVFVAIAVTALVFVNKDDASGSGTGEFHTTVLPDGLPRPSFTLTDQNGQPFDFAAETQGQLTMVFFGYTSCPDVCPLTMDIISQALDGVEVPAKVVFISTDPARDTPERLDQWLGAINSDFVGLTGTPEELVAAQTTMNVTVAIPEPADAKGDYAVGHSSQVFVFTGDDQAHLLYGFGTRQDDWAEDLPKIYAKDEWKAPTP